MTSNSGNNDPHFTSHISGPVVHRNTKCLIVSSLQLLIPQCWIGWICGESFDLLSEFNADFFGKVIQSLRMVSGMTMLVAKVFSCLFYRFKDLHLPL